MQSLEIIKKLNEKETEYLANTHIRRVNKYQSPCCPYCYDGSIVKNKHTGEFYCTACLKEVVIKEV